MPVGRQPPMPWLRVTGANSRLVMKAVSRGPRFLEFCDGLSSGPKPIVRPGERQSTAEIVARPARRIADQHIRDAAALGAWKPGGDEGIARIELRPHPQRTARKKDAHRWNAGALQPLAAAASVIAHVVKGELQVAKHLGVRLLAVDDDGNIGAILAGEVRAVDEPPAARFDALASSRPSPTRAPRKVRVAGVVPLPGHGPAAALHRNTRRRPVRSPAREPRRGSAARRRSSAEPVSCAPPRAPARERRANSAAPCALHKAAPTRTGPAEVSRAGCGAPHHPDVRQESHPNVPRQACCRKRPFQLLGAMNMSTPALIAAGQRSLWQPGSWA